MQIRHHPSFKCLVDSARKATFVWSFLCESMSIQISLYNTAALVIYILGLWSACFHFTEIEVSNLVDMTMNLLITPSCLEAYFLFFAIDFIFVACFCEDADSIS